MKVLYPGSFDPITNGHLDVLRRTLCFADCIVIGVLHNINKAKGLHVDTRLSLIHQSLAQELGQGRHPIEVRTFSGLLVDFFDECGADVVVRGMRSSAEYAADTLQAQANRAMNPRCETIFLPTNPSLAHISSSRVREIARFGGDISSMVPLCVLEVLDIMIKQD